MTKIYPESYTLLEGVSLIQDNKRYDFAHLPSNGDLKNARVIEPARIPNAHERFRRFCEKSKAELTSASLNLFRAGSEMGKVQERIVIGFSNAVSKDFPEAITLNEAREISSKYGLSDMLNKITTEPLIEKPKTHSMTFKV